MKPRTLSLALLTATLALLSLGTRSAEAATSIFMSIFGIPGESLDAKHANWNDVLSFSHGMSLPPGVPRSIHGDFSVYKYLDKSSPLLNLKVNNGGAIGSITLEVAQANSGVVFYRVVLENAYVTSVSSSGSAGGPVTESLTFSYDRIHWTYWPIDATGKPGTPITTGWDRVNNRAL